MSRSDFFQNLRVTDKRGTRETHGEEEDLALGFDKTSSGPPQSPTVPIVPGSVPETTASEQQRQPSEGTPLVAREKISKATRAAIDVLEKFNIGDKFWHRDVEWEVFDIQPDHCKIRVVNFSKQALKRMRRAIERSK